MKFDRIRKELPGVCWTLGLVGVLTAVLFVMVSQLGLEPRFGGLSDPGGDRGDPLGHRVGDRRRGLRRARLRLLLLSAALQLPHHGSAGSRQSDPVHLRRGGGEPARHPAQARTGDGAPARDRHARPLRLLAPAGGGVRRLRHPFRDRGPPRHRHAAQGRAVRQRARCDRQQRAARRHRGARAGAAGSRRRRLRPPRCRHRRGRDLARAARSGWCARSRPRVPNSA